MVSLKVSEIRLIMTELLFWDFVLCIWLAQPLAVHEGLSIWLFIQKYFQMELSFFVYFFIFKLLLLKDNAFIFNARILGLITYHINIYFIFYFWNEVKSLQFWICSKWHSRWVILIYRVLFCINFVITILEKFFVIAY